MQDLPLAILWDLPLATVGGLLLWQGIKKPALSLA